MRLFQVCLAAALLAIAAGAPARAETGPPPVLMQLEPPAQLPAGPQAAKRRQVMLTLSARLLKTVRLEGAVDASATNAVGAKLKRPLAAGQILMGAPNQADTWCAPVRNGLLFAVAPCLIDADKDGRFESATTVSFISNGATDFAITEAQEAIGVVYGKVAPLAQPVGYSPAATADGTPALARLHWQLLNQPKDQPAKPPSLVLWLEAGDDASGTWVFSQAGIFPLSAEGTGEARYGGMTLKILGFDDKKNLKYEVVGAESYAAMPFRFKGAVQTLYISY